MYVMKSFVKEREKELKVTPNSKVDNLFNEVKITSSKYRYNFQVLTDIHANPDARYGHWSSHFYHALLDIKCLGDFYLKRKKRIYELDDIAKSYSISYDFSSMFNGSKAKPIYASSKWKVNTSANTNGMFDTNYISGVTIV